MMYTVSALEGRSKTVKEKKTKQGSKQLNWNREYETYCIFIEISLHSVRLLALKLLMVP